MDGIGSVMTSSPTSSTTGLPSSPYASTFAPRPRHWMTPARSGSSGHGPTNPVAMSVPPENEPTSRSRPTAAYSQENPPGGGGEPVEPTPRISDRSYVLPGSRPAF